jgi:hypothetical protein
MKSLKDRRICIVKDPTPGEIRVHNPADRMEASSRLLSKFYHDGKIRGVTPEGKVFEHLISQKLTHAFLTGLAAIDLRGSH